MPEVLLLLLLLFFFSFFLLLVWLAAPNVSCHPHVGIVRHQGFQTSSQLVALRC